MRQKNLNLLPDMTESDRDAVINNLTSTPIHALRPPANTSSDGRRRSKAFLFNPNGFVYFSSRKTNCYSATNSF